MFLHAEVLPPREESVRVHLRGLEELVDGDGNLKAQFVGDAAARETQVLEEADRIKSYLRFFLCFAY